MSFLSGLIAASAHVLSGPDHLAAVAPVTVEKDRKHWRVGFAWGLGHLFGMLLLGGLFLLFKDRIPVDRISASSETIVGVILILLGLWVLGKIYFRGVGHSHAHIHPAGDRTAVVHKHPHTHPHTHEKDASASLKSEWAVFGIGTVHGFAGVTHILLMLPVLSLPNRTDAILYLAGFGVGTVLSMSMFAWVLGKLRHRLQARQRLLKNFRLAMAFLAILVGIWWILAPAG